MSDELTTLRDQISALDQQLLSLLNQRAEVALAIGKAKKANAINEFFDPKREEAVIQRLHELNQGPLPNDALTQIIQTIMKVCLALQEQSYRE